MVTRSLGGPTTKLCIVNGKILLPKTGVDPMLLAFKASVLACFRGKRDQTHGYLLSRQEGSPLHHWCYAKLVDALKYQWEVGQE